MYYQNYDDYMRSVLGYPMGNDYTNTYYNEYARDNNQQDNIEVQEDLNWYPEIYKIVYPMVCKACDENRSAQINNDLIDTITNVVYANIEVTDNDIQTNQSELKNGDVPNPRVKQQEQRQTRQFRSRNPLLRDLIRILVIRELLGRRRHNRPGGMLPPRPPFPGGPMMPLSILNPLPNPM